VHLTLEPRNPDHVPGSKIRLTLECTTCDRPIDLGVNDDPRCLSFQIRSFPVRRTELFELTRDPGEKEDLSMTAGVLTATLTRALSAVDRQPLAGPVTAPLDDETRSRLEELGYLQDE
jgi:hypothetical protein